MISHIILITKDIQLSIFNISFPDNIKNILIFKHK